MKRTCKECNLTLDEIECLDHEDGKIVHRCECGSLNMELVGPFYVNVHLVDLAYGGPQEGGWYYSCGEPVESRLCDSFEEASEIKVELEKKYNETNKGRRPISSVLSTGRYSVGIEDHFAETFPKERPYYE